MKQITVIRIFFLSLLFIAGTTTAVSVQAYTSFATLYDTNLNNTPGQQGFFYITNPIIFAQATQFFSNGVTVLDTTPAINEFAGYQGRGSSVPTLNRHMGYQLHFQLKLDSESHAGSDRNGDLIDDRAGFSIVLLSSDVEGIEVGFWIDEIWVQEDDSQQAGNLFTHAEGKTFNTTAVLTDYNLTIRDDAYMLETNGQCLLTGSLRNYSNFTGVIDPYETPNYLYMGDNTSSAQAKVQLGNIGIDTTAVQITPQSPNDLTASPNGNNVNLMWAPTAEKYEVWINHSSPYFDPGNTPCSSTSACSIVGTNSHSHINGLNNGLNSYLVRGTNSCGLLATSFASRQASFNFTLQPGGS